MKSGVKHNEKKKMAQPSAGSDDACISDAFLIGDGRRGGRHGRGLNMGCIVKGVGIYNELLGGEGYRGY